MTKTFSKVLAVVLAVCMLFAVPVMAGAESDKFVLDATSVKAASGNWDSDYIGDVVLTLKGDADEVVATDALVVIYGGTIAIKTVKVDDADIVYGSGKVTITVPFEGKVDHAIDYKFVVVEGAFASEDGATNEESSIVISGNALVESLDVEHISTKPIEKIIDWMYSWGLEGFGLKIVNFVVKILNWFLTI